MDALNVVVLAGGPDGEREVSLASGRAVAGALEAGGHAVELWDVGPEDLKALDRAGDWPADVVFPVLHGKWGEGGPMQRLLDERGLAYVGSRERAASLCMDKARTKAVLIEHGLPTPESVRVCAGAEVAFSPPAVVKAVDEGSSLGLRICEDRASLQRAVAELGGTYERMLIERYVRGRELTVGLLAGEGSGELAGLPAIEIVPAAGFYDYQAKYADGSGTRYQFEIDLPEPVLARVGELAATAGRVAGVRHLARVDFLVDEADEPWILEINTLPGFTSHSLLPMAAERAGYDLARLTDHLARLGARGD